MTDPAQQPADMIARLGRHWGWLLAYGILTLLAAIAVLAWPGETLLVAAVLFGFQLIVSGIFRFVTALSIDDHLAGGARVLLALLGVLSGLVVLSYPGLSLLGLATVLGVWLAIFGVMEITAAFRIRGAGHPATPARRLRQRLTG
jgi:uncharacterized membrane protein HdeD (DUF308 family)